MMAKKAIVVFSDTTSFEALGKVSNALMLSLESLEHGDDLKIIFEGAGTKWIGEMEKEEHKMHGLYKMSIIFRSIVLVILLSIIWVDIVAQDYRSVEEAKGLKPGTVAPGFSALDADSTVFSLEKALNEGPVVIIFYRGFWCPVCNKHLGQIQDSLRIIEEKGARVIAVSPEKPEYLDKMAEKTGAQFTLLYDEGYRIADAYDVTFKPGAATLFTYNTFLGANLKETHSDDSQRLPIPATYIVGMDGKIAWRQFDPDYKKRSTVKEILENLPVSE